MNKCLKNIGLLLSQIEKKQVLNLGTAHLNKQ